MSPGAALLSALQEGSFASAMRDSIWLYPLIEIIHILGFAILVGAVVMFDLRVLGISNCDANLCEGAKHGDGGRRTSSAQFFGDVHLIRQQRSRHNHESHFCEKILG
jgi:hypothetical protein